MRNFREFQVITDAVQKGILPDPASLESVSLYLSEIGDHTYLSREQELAIFARLDAAWPGRLDDPPTEIPDAAKPIRAEIVTSVMKLVVAIGKKSRPVKGVEFSDLIQEGNEGALRAVSKFDPARGYRLTTYATWWIRQAIGRAISSQSRTIRIPVHMDDLVKRIKAVEDEYLKANGEPPSIEEIAAAIGEKPERVAYCVASTQYTESLDTLFGDEGKDTVYDITLIEGEGPQELESILDNQELRVVITEILGCFAPRDAKILELRFGLNGQGGRQYTLEEVGQKFGITRERVRQLESAALKKIRHPRYSRKLRKFL